MIRTRPKAKGPQECGPPHRAAEDAADLIPLANAGDKLALRDLYGTASAWIRAGRPVPESIAAWLADRLLEVARTIDARIDGDIGRARGMAKGGGREMEAALAAALRVRRAGVKGRAPSSRTIDRAKEHARIVLHFMEWESMLPEQAIRRAVAYDAAKGLPPVSEKAYSSAWRAHGADLMKEAGLQCKPRK